MDLGVPPIMPVCSLRPDADDGHCGQATQKEEVDTHYPPRGLGQKLLVGGKPRVHELNNAHVDQDACVGVRVYRVSERSV